MAAAIFPFQPTTSFGQAALFKNEGDKRCQVSAYGPNTENFYLNPAEEPYRRTLLPGDYRFCFRFGDDAPKDCLQDVTDMKSFGCFPVQLEDQGVNKCSSGNSIYKPEDCGEARSRR